MKEYKAFLKKTMSNTKQKIFYICSAIVLGGVFPLLETVKNVPESSDTFKTRLPQVQGAKVNVVEKTQNEGDVTIVAEPEPAGVPGSEFVLSAKAAIVVDSQSGNALFNKNAHVPLPIASITKLFTALVVAEHAPEWDRVIKMKKVDEAIQGGSKVVYRGEEVTVRDLWFLSLVKSDNNATRALARSTGLSDEAFIAAMNRIPDRLSLSNTRLVEPTGLSSQNISTAHELVSVLKYALENEYIKEAVSTKEYTFKTQAGRKKVVQNTNDLLHDTTLNILGGKTGYTDAAGYCLASVVAGDNGQNILVVVLGTNSKNNRFRETKDLIMWTRDHWTWPENKDENYES